MNADKVKQAAAALVTFAVITVPGASDLVNAAGGQAEVLAAVVAIYTIVHGVVDYVHGRAIAKD